MRTHATLFLALALGLSAVGLGQDGRPGPQPEGAAARALSYFRRAEGQSFDEFLRRIRPVMISETLRSKMVATLPDVALKLNASVVPATPAVRARLGALRPVLEYHDRFPGFEILAIRIPGATAAFYARSAVLVSEQVIGLLSEEELQAVAAHEMGHEYF